MTDRPSMSFVTFDFIYPHIVSIQQ